MSNIISTILGHIKSNGFDIVNLETKQDGWHYGEFNRVTKLCFDTTPTGQFAWLVQKASVEVEVSAPCDFSVHTQNAFTASVTVWYTHSTGGRNGHTRHYIILADTDETNVRLIDRDTFHAIQKHIIRLEDKRKMDRDA